MPSAKYKEGDVIYAKWPGSDLYYKALVTSFNPVENQYRVKFISAESEADENIFDIPTKYCLVRIAFLLIAINIAVLFVPVISLLLVPANIVICIKDFSDLIETTILFKLTQR